MNHRHRRRIPGQWHRADLQQDHRRKLQAKKKAYPYRHKYYTEHQTDRTRKNFTYHIINETVNIQNNERVLKAAKEESHKSHRK